MSEILSLLKQARHAPGVSISGFVCIGTGTHIGTGASVIDRISIRNNSIIGAGATVINDIPSFCTAVFVLQ